MGSKRRPTTAKLAMDELARRGWRAEKVEQWIRKAGRPTTRDLFGFLDVVALDGAPGVLGIQVTSRANIAARVRKIRGECVEAATDWLRYGNRIEVWGFDEIAGRVVLATRRLFLTAGGHIAIGEGGREAGR